MNDRSGEVRQPDTPVFELPVEAGESLEGVEKKLEKAKESDAGKDEPVSIIKTQQKPATVLDDGVYSQSQSDDPVGVDDDGTPPTSGSELGAAIEKQWVAKAKSLLAQYKDNPHKQKAEISKVKAEYLKTRFNKVVKVEEAG